MAFDVDWLAVTASELPGKDIFSDPSSWKPYAHLWFEVLHAACKNGSSPVFFTPNDPQDFERFGLPDWCDDVRWLWLDCPDRIQKERLSSREGWTAAMIEKALDDASHLRRMIPRQLDTSRLHPAAVAREILLWLES